MFTVDAVSGPLQTFALRDSASDAQVEVAPERGGMVTRFAVGTREVLYLDRDSLVDRSKNVRGGIPVLFPIAGRLRDDQYTRNGRTFAMKQHGFARNSAWSVVSHGTVADARITLSLRSTADTLSVFPWEFEFQITYALAGSTLRIEHTIENRSNETMPVHLGLHPYFRVADAAKGQVRIATRATQAWDNVRREAVAFSGIDLTAAELDLHLLDHGEPTATLAMGDGSATKIEMDQEFTTLVFWTVAGKDFVCMEPWTAPGNAMNTAVGLLEIAPGTTRRMHVSVASQPG